MKRKFRILAAFLAIVMLFTAIPVMPVIAAAADLEDGANYMIVSRHSDKALTVADNSSQDGAGIVQMLAQGYAAQVWTLKKTEDGYWQFINAGSGMAMCIPGGSTERDTKVTQTGQTGDHCKWAVHDTDDGYCWIQPFHAPELCLNVSQNSTNDGQAIIQWPWENSNNEKWTFQKVEKVLDDSDLYPDAVTAADAWLENFFYEENGTGYFESCGGNEFWQCVESIEVVIDAYDQTGDLKYLDAAEKLYAGFVGGNKTGARGTDWSGNDYNDDIMWAVIASTRLYQLTGNDYYLNIGKSNFDMCYERAWDTTFLGGGLWWRTENESKNACVEGPGAIAACLLGDATGDTGYYDKAKAVIDWTIKELYQDDGALWDSVYTNKDPNKWCSSYNQGTFIGACTMLSKHFDDVDYLSYAKKAAERATRLNLNGEQNSGDLIGFKGILGRWLGYYCRESGDDSFVGFMQDWAQTIWDNRNSDDLMWTRFENKTPDDLKNQNISGVNAGDWGYWGCSAAVSWVVNTPGTVDEAHSLKGITTEEAVSVYAEETAEITVTFDPADSQAKGLIWQVADNSVARIDSITENGAVIEGIKEGTTTIAVTSVVNDKAVASVEVTVAPSRNTRQKLEAEDGVLSEGAEARDNGNASGGVYVGNLGEAENDCVTFTFDSPADMTAKLNLYYATAQTREFGVVVNGGETQAVSVGSSGGWMDVAREPVTVEIQLKAGQNTIVVGGTGGPAPNLDYIEIVYPVVAESVTLDRTELEMAPGETVTLKAEVLPDNAADRSVTWTSADEKVATVENGVVTAVAGGTTTITAATANGKRAVCEVTVTQIDHVEVCLAKNYTDVDLGAWYHAALDFVMAENLMKGYGENKFGPDDNMTRAQFAQILYNLEGVTGEVETAKSFTDVPAGDWFYEPVMWAAEEGYVNGYGSTFGPNDKIAREQMVAILYRYAGEPEVESTELPFKDADQISDWALDAVAWAYGNGIVKGVEADTFAPKGDSNRAQVAQILKNYFAYTAGE